MPSSTERNKLPYECYWNPATVHIGTYPCMNISQQLKLPGGRVTGRDTHIHAALYWKGGVISAKVSSLKEDTELETSLTLFCSDSHHL